MKQYPTGACLIVSLTDMRQPPGATVGLMVKVRISTSRPSGEVWLALTPVAEDDMSWEQEMKLLMLLYTEYIFTMWS